jgi:thiamine biosynthesis protein ThiS
MNVTLNGERRALEDGVTILRVLEDLGVKPEATVVQRNDDIVDRNAYATTSVEDGDVLELVRFVGGG